MVGDSGGTWSVPEVGQNPNVRLSDIYIYIYIYQHPPTGHQLRPVRVQQPSTNSLLEGADIYTPGDGSDSFRSRNSLPLLVELAFLLGPLGLGG